MTTKASDCAECGHAVPSGRLSCPSCGALLAAVAGGRPVSMSDGVATGPPGMAGMTGARQADPAAGLYTTVAADADQDAAEALDAVRAAMAAYSVAAAGLREPASASPAVPVARPYRDPSWRPRAVIPAPETVDPRPSPLDRPLVLAAATSASAPTARQPPTPVGSVPSPATVAAPADDDGSPSPAVARVGPVLEIAGWFVIVGGALGLLGFLLPWSRTVIGARGFGGYFDAWGLASPTHVVIAVGLLVALSLGVVPSRVPAWLATGVLGLALGGLVLGLVWPYLVGPLGADVGVLVVALGGVALVVGGGLASWATRQVEVGPIV